MANNEMGDWMFVNAKCNYYTSACWWFFVGIKDCDIQRGFVDCIQHYIYNTQQNNKNLYWRIYDLYLPMDSITLCIRVLHVYARSHHFCIHIYCYACMFVIMYVWWTCSKPIAIFLVTVTFYIVKINYLCSKNAYYKNEIIWK